MVGVDDRVMRTLPAALAQLPVVRRFVVAGTLLGGGVGGLIGLIVGLRVYPPTAWFAIFELGIPAAVVGAVLDLAAGISVRRLRRLQRS